MRGHVSHGRPPPPAFRSCPAASWRWWPGCPRAEAPRTNQRRRRPMRWCRADSRSAGPGDHDPGLARTVGHIAVRPLLPLAERRPPFWSSLPFHAALGAAAKSADWSREVTLSRPPHLVRQAAACSACIPARRPDGDHGARVSSTGTPARTPSAIRPTRRWSPLTGTDRNHSPLAPTKAERRARPRLPRCMPPGHRNSPQIMPRSTASCFRPPCRNPRQRQASAAAP